MKNNITYQELESLALGLLDACGGELNLKDSKRFFEQRGIKDRDLQNLISQKAEELISMP